jgi:hypothetical protein
MCDCHEKVWGGIGHANGDPEVVGNAHPEVVGKTHPEVVGNGHLEVVGNGHHEVFADGHPEVVGNTHPEVVGNDDTDVVVHKNNQLYPPLVIVPGELLPRLLSEVLAESRLAQIEQGVLDWPIDPQLLNL